MKKALLLAFFAMTALFGQSSPADRGWTVIPLPAGKSWSGGTKGFCFISEGADPTIDYWEAGQVTTLVKQSQLDGAKFNSTSGIYPDIEKEYRKTICDPKDPLFLAYTESGGNVFATLFQGTKPVLSSFQPIKVRPIGQIAELDKFFVGGYLVECSVGRCFMLAYMSDKQDWGDVRMHVLELKQPFSPTSLTLLRDAKETISQFGSGGSSCTSSTGHWEIMAKSSKELKANLVHFNRAGKMTIVKDVNTNVGAIPLGCDASGVVMPYFENGVLKIGRFNEGQYPSLETSLMVGSSFAGYKLIKVISLQVMDNGDIFFISETDRGNVVWRLAPKSATPEVVKVFDEKPFGKPMRLVQGGNNSLVVYQELGMVPTPFLLTKEPVVTNFKAEPTTVEPGQPVKLSWDLVGQAKSLTLTPGIIAYTGAGHYEVTVYPAVTMPYTVSASWVGGPPITKTVTVTVLPVRPAFSSASVVNSASGTELSPGSLASIYGKGLSAQTVIADLPLSLKLGGTQVQIEGVACPLLFVSEGQVNFIIPKEIQPGKRKMVVIRDYIFSNEVEIMVVDIAPALFNISREQGLFIDAVSYQLAGTKDNPLRKGGIYIVYANGLTSTACNLKTGEPAPTDRLCSADGEISMKVGNLPAEVLFAGMAPGMLVYQINFRVLEVPGQVSNVVLTVNGKNSQPSPAFFEEEK